MGKGRDSGPSASDIPALEWFAAAIGLLLTFAMVAVMAWEAAGSGEEPPPAIGVRLERVVATPTGFAAEVELRNLSPATAAGVDIQGELRRGGRVVETSTVTIDYVPGASTRRAGLFFRADPRRHALDLRVLGYSEP